jgi:adenosine deaminase
MKKIPKAEIHLHSEATVSTKTIANLYQKQNHASLNKEELDKFFTFHNLTEFVHCFIELQKMLETPEDIHFLFDDLCDYLRENNIIYCEAFFSPSSFLRKGFKFEDMLAVLNSKIDEIQEKYGISIKVLIDVSRTFGTENAMHNLELIEKTTCKHIIGIGLGGDELKGPAKEYSAVFHKAKIDGLHVVAHAGEDVGPQSIIDSIKYLDVERIGHGITAIQDKKLVKYLADKKIPLEICVTSNLFTKKIVKRIEDHPVREFYDSGVFVTINTDDPSMFKTSLINEYWLLHSKLHFTMDEIKQLVLNGFEAAFITDDNKKKYKELVLNAWNKAEKK